MEKDFAREYGIQYSEMAILCLSPKVKHHISCPSVNQVIVPENNNTAFYIDENSWSKLVESLDKKYTLHVNRLEEYERQFIKDGNSYLVITKKIAKLKLDKLTNNKLCKLYLDYQNKLFHYSLLAWSAFILNIFVGAFFRGNFFWWLYK